MIWGKIVKIKQLELSQKENPNTFFFFLLLIYYRSGLGKL